MQKHENEWMWHFEWKKSGWIFVKSTVHFYFLWKSDFCRLSYSISYNIMQNAMVWLENKQLIWRKERLLFLILLTFCRFSSIIWCTLRDGLNGPSVRCRVSRATRNTWLVISPKTKEKEKWLQIGTELIKLDIFMSDELTNCRSTR